MSMKIVLTGALALMLAGCAPKSEVKVERPGGGAATAMAPASLFADYEVVDLSVTVAENMPAHWGTSPAFQRWTYNWFQQEKDQHGNDYFTHEGPYFGQRYVIDEHTGTQSDFPAHFIPPAKSGLPEASQMGEMTGERYPLDRMMGPAVVIDASDIRDKAEPGKSPVITLDRVKQWEAQNGPVKAGEVVLFRSGYSDAYYKPMPEGMRMTFQPVVTKTAPGWPSPEPAVMEYLHGKGVWHLGTDGPSMGPCEGGQAVHVAGLKHGMSWEEMLTNMAGLPVRGAFYVALGVKVRGQSGAISRAVAFVPKKKN